MSGNFVSSQVELSPRAAHVIRPLDIVANDKVEKFNIALSRLDDAVCSYILRQSETSNTIDLKHISQLFSQTKRFVSTL